MPRPFVIWPDPRLRAAADPVPGVDDTVRVIWDEMLAAMYAMPGIGLAAPQLGIGLRLAVVDCGSEKVALRMANPEILQTSDATQTFGEASPNLPGLQAEIERPAEVTVRYLNADNIAEERALSGLWATSVQHQIDHLDGKIYVDRLSPMKRRRMMERYAKLQKKRRRA